MIIRKLQAKLVLAKYLKVFSHTTYNERLLLYQMSRSLPPNAKALEIGSHLGSSALLIGLALSANGGSLVCVDTWNNETMPDGLKNTFNQFLANTNDLSNIITTVRKNSQALVFSDVGKEIDLAFIDGDHSLASVRSDFNLVSQWVKPSGIVMLHDVTHFSGVNIVLGEAMASGNWQLQKLVDSLAVLRKL